MKAQSSIIFTLLWFPLILLPVASDSSQYPNIIFILADDLGWNDVGFHGSNQIPTPNIDALAYSGVILNNYYTQPICTPSRSALMTGRHPIHNGMQFDVLYGTQPWGLPLDQVLLPQYLKRLGYVSRAVGKWHLGHFHEVYAPTSRGFDSHYGYWLGNEDYYTHISDIYVYTTKENFKGYDFRRDMNVSWDSYNKYGTDLFTEEAETIVRSHDTTRPLFLYVAHQATHAPLQAPQELIDRFTYIPQLSRRIFAAMLTLLDESVGRVVAALKDKGMLDNSIIIFSTDNGGATDGYNGNVASNWPLRGCKDTLWEGGVRGAGFIWSPLIKSAPRVHEGLLHIQDWIPTLIAAANATTWFPELKELDGKNQWHSISENTKAPYSTLLHNVDAIRNIASLRNGDWKIVLGRTYGGRYDGWYGNVGKSREYDLDRVKRSLAAAAIENTTRYLPDDKNILQLRDTATVVCASTKAVSRFNNETGSGRRHRHHRRERHSRNRKCFKHFGKCLKVARKRLQKYECQPHIAPCLFNVADDPCEEYNLAEEHPGILGDLMFTLMKISYSAVTPNNKPDDLDSNPKYWNNVWTNWMDFPPPTPPGYTPPVTVQL